MAAGARLAPTKLEYDFYGEYDENHCWGNAWLPIVLEAIGGWEGESNPSIVRIHAEYGSYATATLKFRSGIEYPRQLSHFGTNWIADALSAPRGLQAITVDIEEGFFVICECRYAPIDTSLEAVVAALKVKDDSTQTA